MLFNCIKLPTVFVRRCRSGWMVLCPLPFSSLDTYRVSASGPGQGSFVGVSAPAAFPLVSGLGQIQADLDAIKETISSLNDDVKRLTTIPNSRMPTFSEVARKSTGISSIAPDNGSLSEAVKTGYSTHDSVVVSDIRSTIHSEIKSYNRRSANVIVSGLKDLDSSSDADLFKDLCLTHLSIQINVVKTTRLGTKKNGRVQLLLVQLESSTHVSNLMRFAKLLRSSSDAYIKNNVFINNHLTQAERTAAYLKRVDRRSKATNSNSDGESKSMPATSMDIPSGSEPDIGDSSGAPATHSSGDGNRMPSSSSNQPLPPGFV